MEKHENPQQTAPQQETAQQTNQQSAGIQQPDQQPANPQQPTSAATPTPVKKSHHWKFWLWTVAIVLGVACYCHLNSGSLREENSTSCETELDGDLQVIEVYSRSQEEGRYRIEDRWTKEVLLDHVSWITSEEGDTLVAYAQQRRRGFFNIRSRKANLIDEKFVKVYLYSEGRALAESIDSLYILDTKQRVVASYAKTDERDTEVNTFHKGHMPMIGENGKLGLIDTLGHWSIEPQYDKVSWALDEFWLGITNPVMVDETTGEQNPPHRIMMDSRLRTILEGDWNYMMVTRDGYITVSDRNHWQWRYALDGTLIDDFVCDNVRQLTYETGEKRWVQVNENETHQVDVEETATLLCYTTNEGWEGLMTRDGKIVTPPVFWDVKAVSRNLYLCKYDTTSDHGILLNERGEHVHIDHKAMAQQGR